MKWNIKGPIRVKITECPTPAHRAQIMTGIAMWNQAILRSGCPLLAHVDTGEHILIKWVPTLSDLETDRAGTSTRYVTPDDGNLTRVVISLGMDVGFSSGKPSLWQRFLDRFRVDLVTVVAHEFGHALGLPHNQDGGSLMCEGGPSFRKTVLPIEDQTDLITLYWKEGAK